MSKAYADKVVLVTGANSGIGEATAVKLQQAGAKVFALVRRKEALENARAAHPEIHWVLADVIRSEEVTKVVQAVVREAGRLDVLINNAATFQIAPLDQISDASIQSQFETNIFGLVYVTRAALPALKAARGSIVNISSAAGHKPAAGASIYGATKAALESLTRSWAMELAPEGVRVNAVAPGPTETPVFGKIGLPAEMVSHVKAQFVKQVPLGRIASAEEVAHWVVQVADPSVTWMTGHVLDIDGGMSLT
jgi:NAD(P)-dependent dehydrogenase (short-subunit alcohol dehydrogenase family)